MQDIVRDLAHAGRVLLQSKGWSSIILLSLALGLGDQGRIRIGVGLGPVVRLLARDDRCEVLAIRRGRCSRLGHEGLVVGIGRGDDAAEAPLLPDHLGEPSRIHVFDGDDPLASEEKFPSADRRLTEDADLSQLPVNHRSYVVISTQHRSDDVALKRALEGKARYIALVASKKRTGIIFDQLDRLIDKLV